MRLGGIVMAGPERRRAGAVLAAGLLGVLLVLAAACGVEVPDDVAADIADTTTTTDAPTTTETPTSDDDLEQALIDNGYTLDEARCGAENLREVLDEDDIDSIIEADTIEDISADTAAEFADALRPCVEDGADEDPDATEPDGGDDPDDGDDGGMPDFGDDSEGDVSRSRFLAALISSGFPDEEARCVVEGVFSELDQDEINALFHAQAEDDVPPDVLDTFDVIVEECQG